MLWSSHDKKLSNGNGQKMLLQSIIKKHWISWSRQQWRQLNLPKLITSWNERLLMQRTNWQRLFKPRTAATMSKKWAWTLKLHDQPDNKASWTYVHPNNEHRWPEIWHRTGDHPQLWMIYGPYYIDISSEEYDSIMWMIHATLAEGQHTDPDKSVLIRAGIKLDHPNTYAGGSDLKEFEVFVAGILRWLKMNCLLGEASTDMQANYLGTHPTGEVQEWFYRNIGRKNSCTPWHTTMCQTGLTWCPKGLRSFRKYWMFWTNMPRGWCCDKGYAYSSYINHKWK